MKDSKLRIKRFKRWFQVQREGYTIAQFLKREEAEYFRDNAGTFAAFAADLRIDDVPLRGQTMRRITLYP